jgi:hypothetical protein
MDESEPLGGAALELCDLKLVKPTQFRVGSAKEPGWQQLDSPTDDQARAQGYHPPVLFSGGVGIGKKVQLDTVRLTPTGPICPTGSVGLLFAAAE